MHRGREVVTLSHRQNTIESMFEVLLGRFHISLSVQDAAIIFGISTATDAKNNQIICFDINIVKKQ